jgi:hypothetical protein
MMQCPNKSVDLITLSARQASVMDPYFHEPLAFVFTDACPFPSPTPPTIVGPDGQVIGSIRRYRSDTTGTYIASNTDHTYGMSVYNGDTGYMIYWCNRTSQWFLSYIQSLQTVDYVACFGWDSDTVSNGPGKLCNATWSDDSFTITSSECVAFPPSPPAIPGPDVTVIVNPADYGIQGRSGT